MFAIQNTSLTYYILGAHVQCDINLGYAQGADVNRQTTTNDHTVLSLACAGGHLAVVELLLECGADPTHKLKVGKSKMVVFNSITIAQCVKFNFL